MLPSSRFGNGARALAILGASALTVTACSVGSIGGGSSTDGTQIKFLVSADNTMTKLGQALIDGFQATNPGAKVTLETQPGGTEGENLTKTKVSTGEMADVFYFNAGSLLQALNPDTNLVPLGDQPWVSQLDPVFKQTVSTAKGGPYGAPLGSTLAGGLLYNKKVYADLNLKVPTSWAEFISNNAAIAKAGKVAPVVQTYGDVNSAQLWVLTDFANVVAQDPGWAAKYTQNKVKYHDQPALQGFLNQEAAAKAGFFNKDFASADYEAGIKMIATGTGAQYPTLTNATSALSANFPDKLNDVGFFPMPAQDAKNTRLTVWMPNAMYIPKTTEGAKLKAAKKFIAYVNSSDGCAIQAKIAAPSGPYAINSCQLPAKVASLVTDLLPYFDKKLYSSALEFSSPIKGPNLQGITVQVGSGISTGEQGAKLYDEDVKKQAQQLGLPGW